MQRNTMILAVLAVSLGFGCTANADTDWWDMMNPAWWMGLDDDDDDDDYWRYHAYGPGRYAYGSPYGWNAGPYGYGYPVFPAYSLSQPQSKPAAPAPKIPE